MPPFTVAAILDPPVNRGLDSWICFSMFIFCFPLHLHRASPGFTGLHRAQVWKQVAELAAVGGLARGSSVTGSSHSLAQEWDSEGTVVPVPVTDKLGDETTCFRF
jgi:hypothetical protein